METAIQRWGNSLAVRIPKAFAEQAKMRKGTSVRLTLERGRLVVAPTPKRELSLKELVAKVTPKNLHSETDWGQATGREMW